MTYQGVWWHDNTMYGARQTWPNNYEQYRRPADERYYNIPVEPIESRLYYRYPTIGMPKYRASFRNKPHSLPAHYPEGIDSKPRGYHGRVYYEQCGPTKFAYNGPEKDELHYLERPPYNPSFSKLSLPTTDPWGYNCINLPQCPKPKTLELVKDIQQHPVVTRSKIHIPTYKVTPPAPVKPKVYTPL